MTTAESLSILSTYPISELVVEKLCIQRGLDSSLDITQEILNSMPYELVTADIYRYLAITPSIREQEVTFTVSAEDRKRLMYLADEIYQKYNDPLFSGSVYGYQGESFT